MNAAEIEFLRDKLDDPFWSILYHEHELPKAILKLAMAAEMVKRCGIDPKAPRGESDEDGETVIENVAQFVLDVLDDAQNNVEHHEAALARAHKETAYVKAILMRGNFTEFSIDDLRKEAEAQAAERFNGARK